MPTSEREDLPPAVRDAPPATQRVYLVLRDADAPLPRRAIQQATRHAGGTVREALVTLREADVAEQRMACTDQGPVPRYALADGG